MTIEQLALVSLGHITLALTFVLGVLVGNSLKRKDSHGYGNEGAEGKGSKWWHDIERRRFEEVAGRSRPGGGGSRSEAGVEQRLAVRRHDDRD